MVGHLVLDHLRRLAGVLGIDDDLHVGQIGQCVQRRLQHRKNAADDDEQCREQDQEGIPSGPLDDLGQHGALCSVAGVGGWAGTRRWYGWLRLRCHVEDTCARGD